jgi:hypothetical protein
MKDWKTCCSKRIVKEVSIDPGLITSLQKSSKNKLVSALQLQLTEITAAAKVSLAYDSLREMLEAVALQKGYKVYNHECYTAFLTEIVKESELAAQFDELRKERNAINYYGKEISPEDAIVFINKTVFVKKKVKLL